MHLLLLSCCKFSSISLYLLQTVPVFDKYGNQSYRPFYNASIHGNVSSTDYTVYFGVSIFVLVTMVFLPTIFILFYQIRIFQRCLHCCRIRCTLLHEMANILQGCFKNGTTPGTRDYRWFAGLYLLLRIVLVFSINQKYYSLVYQVIACIMCAVVATLRPYRIDKYNTLDSLAWLLFGLTVGVFVYNRAYDNIGAIHFNLCTLRLLCMLCFMEIHCLIHQNNVADFMKVSKSQILIDDNYGSP